MHNQPYQREYVCDGMCLQARPSIHEIAERRIMEAELYGPTYLGIYATPAQRMCINNILDASHDVAHMLVNGVNFQQEDA